MSRMLVSITSWFATLDWNAPWFKLIFFSHPSLPPKLKSLALVDSVSAGLPAATLSRWSRQPQLGQLRCCKARVFGGSFSGWVRVSALAELEIRNFGAPRCAQ
jgi:hypothetical protein